MINSRLSVAVHILTLLELNKSKRITSEFIASSVNTNPVVIRRTMSLLNKAGLIHSSPGVAGAVLTRPMNEISLLDVYRAVQAGAQVELFAIHENPNPDCIVGKNIQTALEMNFVKVQNAMEQELANTTLDLLTAEILRHESTK